MNDDPIQNDPAWKSPGPKEINKGLNSTRTTNDINSNTREDATSVGLNKKHMACERIKTNKVVIRLQNDHAGHNNRDTGSGTLKPFHSDSWESVGLNKINTRMSTYNIGMDLN